MTITFTTPPLRPTTPCHHEDAAEGNIEAAQRAISALSAVLSEAERLRQDPAARRCRRGEVLRAGPHGARGAGPRQLHPGSVSPPSPTSRSSRWPVSSVRSSARRPGLPVRGRGPAPRRAAGRARPRHRRDHHKQHPGDLHSRARHLPQDGRAGASAGGSSTTSGRPGTTRCRSTCCSSTRRGSCRCTATPRSRGSRRSRWASATSASSRRSTPARTRGVVTPATTPTGPGQPPTRTARPPSWSTCPPYGARRPPSSRCGAPSTATGTGSTASRHPATAPWSCPR